MPNHRVGFAGAVLLLSCACAHGDVLRERKALLDADARFARETAERGVEAWAAWFTEDGTMYPARIDPVQGRAAIRELMSDLFDPRTGRGALRLDWQPTRAEVSESGELGWTTGTSRALTPDGERRGKYITIWHKQADGSWKVAADLGNQGPLAPPPAGPAGQKPPG
jgi:ketosteroid isomerase-like protein